MPKRCGLNMISLYNDAFHLVTLGLQLFVMVN